MDKRNTDTALDTAATDSAPAVATKLASAPPPPTASSGGGSLGDASQIPVREKLRSEPPQEPPQ